MLTAAQREKCRSIAAALDRGDQGPWLKAEPDLSAEARGMVWDFRQAQVARAAKAGEVSPQSAAKVTARIETSLDLDYWPPIKASEPDGDEEDDDGDEEQTTKACPSCGGKGRGDDGDVCEQCNGDGVVPIDLDDGD